MYQLTLLIIPLPYLFIAHLLIPGVFTRNVTITNKCNHTVWPGIASNTGVISTTGFSLEKNESKTLMAPASWGGRIWGRTYCTQDSRNFSCLTGDCGSGKVECSGKGFASPATLAEILLDSLDDLDFFDVSIVNGYNLPLLVEPQGSSAHNCSSTGCMADLNSNFPSELMVTSSDGKSIGCKSACAVTGLSLFCCDGVAPCRPSLYSQFFKNACPQAYSYAIDDGNTTFTCRSAHYQITFCPDYNSTVSSTNGTTANNSRPSPGEITPSPLPEIKPNATSRRDLAPMITGIVGGGIGIIFLVIIIWRVRLWSKSKKSEEDVEDDYINQVPGMPVRISYEDLRNATNDFKERLGRGGFGSVFRGVLADGTVIAVKRLDKLGQEKRAFLAEVEAIGNLHHFNLVRLIGFCAEKSYRLLVFECMSNGSLDNWIFKKIQGSTLDWQTRKKIILDIAKGLAYLHEECRQTIMHLDIKPQNIILDSNFNAKISDFGLSKLIDKEMSQVQLSMRGTPGYLAPEWRQPVGRITVKVDIYSFGIVLLEVVCGRRNADNSQPDSAFHLLSMLQKKADQDNLIDIVENLDDEGMQSHTEEVIRMIKIAAWCLQDDPERRPFMSTVVKVLEGVMEVDSNLVYKFSHAITSSPVVNHHISSAPLPASVLSYPR